MEDFMLFDNDDFETFVELSKEEEINKQESKLKYKNCDECNIQMSPDINNTLTCMNCGFIKTVIIENTEYEPSMSGYNTNSYAHMPIKCVGKHSSIFQKQLRNDTSQYSIIQETHLRRALEKLNNKSQGLIIPKNIISSVVSQYKIMKNTVKDKIKVNPLDKSLIHRGEILKGVVGALIYYECLNEGIVRKPKEISNWYGICENNLSKGDKILRDLEAKNIIKLPINVNNDKISIISHLKRTGIDLDNQYFLIDILEKLDELKIGNPNARQSTKIAALIFMLVISKKYNISPETIREEFTISVSTFKAFYLEIFKNKHHIQDVLDKHNIVLPDKIPRKARSNKNL